MIQWGAVEVPDVVLGELRHSARLKFVEALALRIMLAGQVDAVSDAPFATTLAKFSFLFFRQAALFAV